MDGPLPDVGVPNGGWGDGRVDEERTLNRFLWSRLGGREINVEVSQVFLKVFQSFSLSHIVWKPFEVAEPHPVILPEDIPSGAHKLSLQPQNTAATIGRSWLRIENRRILKLEAI